MSLITVFLNISYIYDSRQFIIMKLQLIITKAKAPAGSYPIFKLLYILHLFVKVLPMIYLFKYIR